MKDPDILVNVYDDAVGVTAGFNLNNFKHESRWNDKLERIEMHMISRVHQSVTVADKQYIFAAGESLHTENSHKFIKKRLENLATEAGWNMSKFWVDADELFAVSLLEPSR